LKQFSPSLHPLPLSLRCFAPPVPVPETPSFFARTPYPQVSLKAHRQTTDAYAYLHTPPCSPSHLQTQGQPTWIARLGRVCQYAWWRSIVRLGSYMGKPQGPRMRPLENDGRALSPWPPFTKAVKAKVTTVCSAASFLCPLRLPS
jgi:hypothetical protein